MKNYNFHIYLCHPCVRPDDAKLNQPQKTTFFVWFITFFFAVIFSVVFIPCALFMCLDAEIYATD